MDEASKTNAQVGVDLDTGKPMLPAKLGIWDNVRVKKQLLHLGSMIAVKLLLVDEVPCTFSFFQSFNFLPWQVMRAGRNMGKN